MLRQCHFGVPGGATARRVRPTPSLQRTKRSVSSTTEGTKWNPQLYNKFQEERMQPFRELLKLIKPYPGLKFLDVGCGTGEPALEILKTFPDSSVHGFDNSKEMLEVASKLAQSNPKLSFQLLDISDASPVTIKQKYDVVIANASIHWAPDHNAVIPRLLQLITEVGQFAVQIPTNHTQEFYQILREVAALPLYDAALKGWKHKWPILEIDQYASLLWQQRCRNIQVYEKVFPHVLDKAEDVVDWLRGTGMQAYLSRMPPELRPKFVEEFRYTVKQRHPEKPVFFPFRRMFISATKRYLSIDHVCWRTKHENRLSH